MDDQDINAIFNTAQDSVNNKSSWEKFKTAVWYSGRKFVRNSPKRAVQLTVGKVAEVIPFLGAALNEGGDSLWTKYKDHRRQEKRKLYGEDAYSSPEIERKFAKHELKELKHNLIGTIDRNLVKLKDSFSSSVGRKPRGIPTPMPRKPTSSFGTPLKFNAENRNSTASWNRPSSL